VIPGDFIRIKNDIGGGLLWFQDVNDRWMSCTLDTIFIVLGVVPSAHPSGVGDKIDKIYMTDGIRIGCSPRWAMVRFEQFNSPGKDG
jgi:hypothetical protein